MIMTRGVGGEAVSVVKRRRMTDEELRQTRRKQFFVMQLQGRSSEEIGKYFSFSRQFVAREIKAIPASEKSKLERGYNRVG